MEKKPVALFIGRFQPFHKGHLAALKWIAERSSNVIVAIGSAEKENEPENPFSEKERERMIGAELREAGLGGKCLLVPVTDINDNERWVAHVDASVPAYDICYSNNSLVKRLMRKAGKEVSAVPFFRKEKFNATKIRGRMRKRQEWRDRVPGKVAGLLSKMKVEERMGRL